MHAEKTNSRQDFDNLERCVDAIIKRIGTTIVLGLPLGLGKANHLANALFRRAEQDSSIQLTILTALTLAKPEAKSDLHARFLDPINARMFDSYPALLYAEAQRNNELPTNIRVHEFFFPSAANLSNPQAQQSYVSANYTHAIRDLVDRGVNVIVQLLASREERLSLSCNADITRALLRKRACGECDFLMVGQLNSALPFMYNSAELAEDEVDFLLAGSEFEFPLFATPNRPISRADYAMALHTSALVQDGGTLQIGIGALGDAVAYVLGLRQQHNDVYRSLLLELDESWQIQKRESQQAEPQTGQFTKGLYCCSEMMVYGFLHLRRCGVIKRLVYDDDVIQQFAIDNALYDKPTAEFLHYLLQERHIDSRMSQAQFDWLQSAGVLKETLQWQDDAIINAKGLTVENDFANSENLDRLCQHGLAERLKCAFYLHAAFFVGSTSLYETLALMPEYDARGINMTDVLYVNQLYGQEALKRAQRVHGRFINTALMVTLTGAVVSDTLKNGAVLSGVGGQYNFVAMAHELNNARSIIALTSTRIVQGRTQSNIVWEYAQTTVPRHLRDIVVTEYGVAWLRGESDRDVICALLAITDSRFQKSLLEQAKSAGKVEQSYEIPARQRHNFPEKITQAFATTGHVKLFPHYPFGTDFTDTEAHIALALQYLKKSQGNKLKMAELLVKSMFWPGLRNRFTEHLQRMDLLSARGVKARIGRRLLLAGLTQTHRDQIPLKPAQ